MQYRAGVALLDPAKPHVLIYRSPQPLLWPELPAERESLVDDVVFPTAIDPRADIAGNAYDIYYGMADRVIGTLDVRALSSAGTILQAFGSNLSK
jgi:beta-1,2-mannobiose phosphorylase / 1,2-beta-oligomannan phosphorylase